MKLFRRHLPRLNAVWWYAHSNTFKLLTAGFGQCDYLFNRLRSGCLSLHATWIISLLWEWIVRDFCLHRLLYVGDVSAAIVNGVFDTKLVIKTVSLQKCLVPLLIKQASAVISQLKEALKRSWNRLTITLSPSVMCNRTITGHKITYIHSLCGT